MCVLFLCPGVQVDPPQERGVSHERKLKSYAAEAAFYSHYCSRALTSGGAAAVAEALLVDVSPPTHFLFVLRDLRVGYPKSKSCLEKQVGGLAGHTAVAEATDTLLTQSLGGLEGLSLSQRSIGPFVPPACLLMGQMGQLQWLA
jgi:hypothetical protein